ncbi:cysteine synthase A [Rhodobacterales bacterium HKCCE2091]|nr:cysteine synthase A [Rhodobacterales bacterium HKCCE2091]
MAIKTSILDTIGNTPVIRINNIAPEGVELFVKLEAANPGGSVKDRLALAVIEAAERDGSLKPGQTVIEATSGNTGIGLAIVCAQKGYPLVVTMAESFSVERRKLMRFLGAKVVLTPASEKGTGMVRKACELAKAHGWFLARQFENPANPEIHAETTAREIIADFGPDGLDYFVSGFGTGGTIGGVSRTLRAESPSTRIVAAEPDNSPLLASGHVQAFAADGSAADSHPGFRPHVMQGWSPDFISKIANEALSDGRIDQFAAVRGEDAMRCARDLARKEGMFVGITAGATFAAALEVARTAPKGARILAMLPDTGERYLSTPLFADIPEEMTDDEMELSRSTPDSRFDIAASPPAPAAAAPKADPEALAEVRETVAANPVVLYALEWCEFCWSVRRMFQAAGIEYLSVDLDSAAYRDGDRGGRIRAALREITGAPTIPQVFVGGAHLGGATETFDAYNSGVLAEMLEQRSIQMAAAAENAYGYLPNWLHPR